MTRRRGSTPRGAIWRTAMKNEREMDLETALTRLLRKLGRYHDVIVAARAWDEWRASSASSDERPREEIEDALFDAIASL